MRKGWICLLIGVSIFLSMLPLSTWGQGYSRPITADYYGIDIWVDGLAASLKHEAFVFDGDIYMALPDLKNTLNLEGDYEGKKGLITLKSNSFLQQDLGKALAAEMVQKDYEITSVERQIEALEKELQEAEEAAKEVRLSKYEVSSIRDMRSYLRDHFDYLEDIPVSIDFRRIREDRYELMLTFSSRYHNDFEAIDRRHIEYYLEDMFYAVREMYDEDARLEGEIRDNLSRNYRTYVSFDTRRDSLQFDFKRAVHRSSGFLSPSIVASNGGGGYPSRILHAAFPTVEIYLDDTRVDWFKAPFLYNDVLYLCLDDVAEALYLHYELDVERELIAITTNNVLGGDMLHTSGIHLSSKDAQLARLNPILERLQEEISFLRNSRYPYRSVSTVSGMQSYLKVYFGELEDIPMSIRLRERRNNEYRLDITFSSSYRWDFEDLDRRIIEGWLDDMFYAIRGLYDPEATIIGDIRDSRSSSRLTYLEFDTKDEVLAFDFKRRSHREDIRGIRAHQLEDHLYNEARHYDGIRFDYDVFVNRRDIDLLISYDNRRFEDWSLIRKMNYLQFLHRAIDYDVNVNGRMMDRRYEEEVLRFSFEEDRIRSFDLLEETENYLEDRYGNYPARWEDINLVYVIREKSPDVFDVKIEGDFSREGSEWRYIEENDRSGFEGFIRDALSYIQDLWDVTVLGEVVDQNNRMVASIDLYDENVGPVYASPSSGGITSGSEVELWSNTSDATIFYTTEVNGTPSDPTTSSTRYRNPIILEGEEGDTITIKAFATKDGMTSSRVNTFTYEMMDLAGNLDNIIISSNPLNFDFDPKVYTYDGVTVDDDVESIKVTAVGDGTIFIDGEEVASGRASEAIALTAGVERKIEIIHQEKDRGDRVYTIYILREAPEDSIRITLQDYTLRAGIVGVFQGTVTSSDLSDFDSYRMVIFSRSDNYAIGSEEVTSAPIEGNGEFFISGFHVDAISRAIGYRYEIWDEEKNIKVGEGLLNIK